MRFAAYAASALLSVTGAALWGGSILVLDRAALAGLTCAPPGPAGRRLEGSAKRLRPPLAACGGRPGRPIFALTAKAAPPGFPEGDRRSLLSFER